MTAAPDNYELHRQLSVMDEQMNTNQARYEGALERLRAYMARRDIWLLLTVVGVVISTVGVATTILGLLITLPPSP